MPTKTPNLFTFTADGESHSLPLASEGRKRLTGRDFRDAMLDGDSGEWAYLLKALEAAGPDEDSLEAFYSLPQSEMTDLLYKWSQHGDGDGTSLGE